ncbi:PiggyBac transposable element-derived protein 3, partial [Stegodyphus mimosarum]
MEPPDNVVISDEDSGDEDYVGMDNLSGNQLRANAEIRFRGKSNIILSQSVNKDIANENSNDEDNTPPLKKKRFIEKRKWVMSDLTNVQREKWNWNEDWNRSMEISSKSPCNLFEQFFDDDVLDYIVYHTKLYARQKGNHVFDITSEEMKAFIGILIVSGYVAVPRRRMFWENSDDTKNIAVSNAMRRNRFEEIMKYLHFCDNNNIDKEDKYAKLRNMMCMINDRFLKAFPLQQGLDVDEAMIPYYGRHPGKQFIRGKPIRFGFKAWCLNCPNGYLVQFDFYQGKDASKMENQKEYGLEGSVVLDLISELPKHPFTIAIDNYFTSIRLVEELSNSGFAVVGTARENRIGNCPIETVKNLRKKERGVIDYRKEISSGVIVVRWKDSNVVTTVSNCTGVNPLGSAKRWSSSEKQKIAVPQPHAITIYNKFMGGTDRMDENISNYRIGFRGKKWWFPLAMFLIDASIQNAWLLHRMFCKKEDTMDQLEFRRTISKNYLKQFGVLPKPGRAIASTKMSKRVTNEIRFDEIGHTIVVSKTQLRCAQCPGLDLS